MNVLIANSALVSLQKQILRLTSALSQLSEQMPLDVECFNPDNMDDTFLLQLDGFRARFSDLQDYMGHTFIPMITKLDEDENAANPLSTRERNVLMERKGIFELSEWQKLREIRNGFAHEYPDEHIEKALLLNAAWQMSQPLIAIAQSALKYVGRMHHAPN